MEKQEEVKVSRLTKMAMWAENNPKAVFWMRFVAFFLFACALPFAFIVWRFDLFKSVSKIQIGGWGILAILLVVVFVFVVLRYVKMAINAKYSLTAQVLGGICRVILPLVAVLVILYCVRNEINLLLQVLGCITLCEFIAIPLNPLPQWAYEQQKDVKAEDRKETVDYLLDQFFKKKNENQGGGQ